MHRPFSLFLFLLIILLAYQPAGTTSAAKTAVDPLPFIEQNPPPRPKYGLFEWAMAVTSGYDQATSAIIDAEHFIRDHPGERVDSLPLASILGKRQASITLAVAHKMQEWQVVEAWLGAAWNADADPAEVRAALESAGWLIPYKQPRYAMMVGEWHPLHKQWLDLDIDRDGRNEWMLSICLLQWQDGSCLSRGWGQTGQFWIVSQGQVVYRDGPEGVYEQTIFDAPNITNHSADLTGDGRSELITEQTDCGVNNCYNTYKIISALGERMGAITGGFGMSYSTIQLEDRTGDGLPDLLVHGGLLGSSGAGPRRQETAVYAWTNPGIGQVALELDPAVFRVHVLYEANEAFDRFDDETAVSLYLRVINDETLKDTASYWHIIGPFDYDDSRRFAAFRLILLYLRQGSEDEALHWRDWLTANYANNQIAQAAQRLFNELESDHHLATACTKITAWLASTDATGVLSDLGYGNPQLDTTTLCPIE